MIPAVGIDFGTTNSAVALAEQGKARIARHGPQGRDATFRSILCFWPSEDELTGVLQVASGADAIEAFRTHGNDARLIQSVKSFVASASFEQTAIFGHRYTIEALIGELLKGLRRSAEKQLGALGSTALVGRPVHFAGSHPKEELALTRLRSAYRLAGFNQVEFVEEPVAAAHHFALGVHETRTCLVADFGGGTSDFTIIRVEPGGSSPRIDTLAQAGAGIAGDTFDDRIVRNVVCPALGMGSYYRSMFGQRLEVPVHLYAALARWHQLSMLRNRRTLQELRDMMVSAEQPQALQAFLFLIENELGYPLHTAVTELKAHLSGADDGWLRFEAGPVTIERQVTRAEFEQWIAQDLLALGQTVDSMFTSAGIAQSAIDQVFMTGGSSLIPAVRQVFADRFGADKLAYGDEFVSIAAGMSLLAAAR